MDNCHELINCEFFADLFGLFHSSCCHPCSAIGASVVSSLGSLLLINCTFRTFLISRSLCCCSSLDFYGNISPGGAGHGWGRAVSCPRHHSSVTQLFSELNICSPFTATLLFLLLRCCWLADPSSTTTRRMWLQVETFLEAKAQELVLHCVVWMSFGPWTI